MSTEYPRMNSPRTSIHTRPVLHLLLVLAEAAFNRRHMGPINTVLRVCRARS